MYTRQDLERDLQRVEVALAPIEQLSRYSKLTALGRPFFDPLISLINFRQRLSSIGLPYYHNLISD